MKKLLWMAGGPSHIDTWDSKPDRPWINRGPFGVTQTKLPGVVISEHLPKQAAMLENFQPHMHLRGKSFRYEAQYPDGTNEILLDVPRYDFNWQLLYKYAEPRPVPRGSELKAIGWFDNSTKNPANPDATKTVREEVEAGLGEILEAMFPGLSMPAPEVCDVAPYAASVRAVNAAGIRISDRSPRLR